MYLDTLWFHKTQYLFDGILICKMQRGLFRRNISLRNVTTENGNSHKSHKNRLNNS